MLSESGWYRMYKVLFFASFCLVLAGVWIYLVLISVYNGKLEPTKNPGAFLIFLGTISSSISLIQLIRYRNRRK